VLFERIVNPLEGLPTMSPSETKIELVTEAIEALVLASVIAATAADKDRALNHRNVLDAREALKGCLREFLRPSLRVVTERVDAVSRNILPEPNARPAYPTA
jgi:hypothetical protein